MVAIVSNVVNASGLGRRYSAVHRIPRYLLAWMVEQ